MQAEYYAGKWNDHDIVFAIGKNQNLFFDGKVIAESKPLSTGLSGEDPIESGLFVRVLYDGRNCFCIVGKPLETSYDKTTKTFFFFFFFNNHFQITEIVLKFFTHGLLN